MFLTGLALLILAFFVKMFQRRQNNPLPVAIAMLGLLFMAAELLLGSN